MLTWGAFPKISATRASPATSLPQEIIGMIIAHLMYDIRSLRACTLICRSWYTAAVPHLHHDLFIDPKVTSRNLRWPNPLQCKHELGLLPLVKTFWIRRDYGIDAFSSNRFDNSTLRHFSALSNVNRLMIESLDIPSFMPEIRQYFGHFLPTVRELSLTTPEGSCRQIIFFIGLFEHLETLEIYHDTDSSREEMADDLTLIPSSTPPLRGWLRLVNLSRVGLLKDMIDLFGGIRFRWIEVFNVGGVGLLLDACADTLECLRLNPADPRSKQLYLSSVQALADDLAVRSSLQDFDLSRNKALRKLQVTAASINWALRNCESPDTAPMFLKHMLSTSTSFEDLDIMVIYEEIQFHGIGSVGPPGRPNLRKVSETARAAEASWHQRRFKFLREARKARDFRLVLCASVWDPVGEYAVRMLKEALADEKARKGFEDSNFEPSVVYDP